jgi:hypothetical protein
MVKLLDADTGKPLSTVNIEKAAKVVTKEGPFGRIGQGGRQKALSPHP